VAVVEARKQEKKITMTDFSKEARLNELREKAKAILADKKKPNAYSSSTLRQLKEVEALKAKHEERKRRIAVIRSLQCADPIGLAYGIVSSPDDDRLNFNLGNGCNWKRGKRGE
jgi:hypothetical protein